MPMEVVQKCAGMPPVVFLDLLSKLLDLRVMSVVGIAAIERSKVFAPGPLPIAGAHQLRATLEQRLGTKRPKRPDQDSHHHHHQFARRH